MVYHGFLFGKWSTIWKTWKFFSLFQWLINLKMNNGGISRVIMRSNGTTMDDDGIVANIDSLWFIIWLLFLLIPIQPIQHLSLLIINDNFQNNGITIFSIVTSPFSIVKSPFCIVKSPFSTAKSQFSIAKSHFFLVKSPFSIVKSPFSIVKSQFSIAKSRGWHLQLLQFRQRWRPLPDGLIEMRKSRVQRVQGPASSSQTCYHQEMVN